jgi:hypothetical protein
MDALSGVLQTITTTGLGYLDRRLDIDLERRLTRATEPRIDSTQTPVNYTVPGQVFGIPTGTLVPLLIVGVVAVVLLKS